MSEKILQHTKIDSGHNKNGEIKNENEKDQIGKAIENVENYRKMGNIRFLALGWIMKIFSTRFSCNFT